MHSATLLILNKINKIIVLEKPKYSPLIKTRPKGIYSSKQVMQEAGFTLIEVLVVVIMVGVLAAIVAPSWLAFVNKQQVNKANDVILGAVQEAQREAKKTKRSYSVSFRTNNNIPQIAIHPNSVTASSLSDDRWKSLGADMEISSKKLLLGTNIDTENAVNTSNTSVSYNLSTPKTITFDYMGNLPNANFGAIPTGSTTSSEAPGLKVVVAVPVPGNPTQASGIKRCVILQTLIGGMRTEKNTECDDQR